MFPQSCMTNMLLMKSESKPFGLRILKIIPRYEHSRATPTANPNKCGNSCT